MIVLNNYFGLLEKQNLQIFLLSNNRKTAKNPYFFQLTFSHCANLMFFYN